MRSDLDLADEEAIVGAAGSDGSLRMTSWSASPLRTLSQQLGEDPRSPVGATVSPCPWSGPGPRVRCLRGARERRPPAVGSCRGPLAETEMAGPERERRTCATDALGSRRRPLATHSESC